MARELNLTTQKQEFIKESYLKEMHTRINWWRHHKHNGHPVPHIQSKVKDHYKLPSITDSCFQTRIDQSEHHLKNGRKSEIMEPSPIESEMKPVSPGTRSLLYNGTSKEEKGRYRYLKVRNSFGPEEKYCYPIATSWVYGWHLGNLLDNSCPQYRRCRIVNDTFYRKNGIPTQPSHRDMAL